MTDAISRLRTVARAGRSSDETALFEPVAPSRASSAIADQIRTAIVSGRIGAGERLPPERELAEQFGVSRVTVRDALRALEANGLIKVRVGARGGAFVTAPTGALVAQAMSDMMAMAVVTPDEVVEARLVVELGTVTLACVRATEDDLKQLRELWEHGRRELTAKRYTRELSWAFHALLAHGAHNAAVEGLAQSFKTTLSLHPLRAREPRARSHALTVEEHGRILEALEQRDGEAARREMAAHLMRGTKLEEKEAALLALWRAPAPKARQRSATRRAK
jgi:GntR family transcriptional regulator, transcriptional repressor for pyruvate dehydrogenase complex